MTEQESYQNGRYVIVRELGRGGTGVVLLAFDQHIERHVALKVLPPIDDTHAARLKREATIMGVLNHPNIATIFDLFVENDRPCLVLEYVPGWDLEGFLKTGHLDDAFCVHLLHGVAKALAFLHGTTARHADITPRNILIRDDYAIKLIDFGLAKRETDPRVTKTGYFGGTPGYVAPEVWMTGKASAASDIWSLGTVMQQAVNSLPVLPPRNGPLMSIINRMLQEVPEGRPTAAEVVAMMSPWVVPLVADAAENGLAAEEAERRTVPFIPEYPEQTEPFISADAEGSTEPFLSEFESATQPTLPDHAGDEPEPGTGRSGNVADQGDGPALSVDSEPLLGILVSEDEANEPDPRPESEDSFEPLVGIVLPDDEPDTGSPANQEPQPSAPFTYGEAKPEEDPVQPASASKVASSRRKAAKSFALVLGAVLLLPLSFFLMTGTPFREASPKAPSVPESAISTTATAPSPDRSLPKAAPITPPTTAASEASLSPDGPWSMAELVELIRQPYYNIAGNMMPGTLGLTLKAARYEPLPLGDVDFAMKNQVETGSSPRQEWRHFRLTRNKARAAFTVALPSCADPTVTRYRPGFYLITPITDDTSEFNGPMATTNDDKRYALVAEECLQSPPPPQVLEPGVASPAGPEYFPHFRLPMRPDGSWDQASLNSLGVILVDKDGWVVALEDR